MERVVFIQHVLSALAHLDEGVLLARHPLAAFLFPTELAGERGRALRELLSTAIDELRPAEATETNLGALRRYEYLDGRYRRGLRASHVAQELGLSDRQARRIHQEAVEALAEIVWDRRPRASASPRGGPPLVATEGEAAPSELEAEVARLGATPSSEGTQLGEVLRSAVTTVLPLAERHRVDLEVAPLPPVPLVAVDRAVLRQVLVNVLVASIETGARRLEVDVRGEPEAVEVSLTTRFRASTATSPSHPAQHDELLRVVRRLVQLQAGAVDARPANPETSVVTLTLPVVRPVTVLLVDDNPDTLRLFRRYLGGASYRPIEAMDGRRALELARQAQPGAVVLDVMLPSQDGWEILQALRNDLETEHLPVVVCSVLHQEELAEALGATAYLAKPVSREALLGALRRVLSRPARSPAPLGRVG